MSLKDEIEDYVGRAMRETWSRRDGTKVPETQDIGLKNEGVNLDAVVLYADLAESTELVRSRSAPFAAEVYKCYLYAAARIVTAYDGTITAYDGDRLMAVYLGDSKNSNAAATALRINWAVQQVIQPALDVQYPKSGFVLRQKVGVDASSVMVARTGVRGNNDLVWVGTAANIAAKLAARGTTYSSYITETVYSRLAGWAKLSTKGDQNRWRDLGAGPEGVRVYGSTWWWSP